MSDLTKFCGYCSRFKPAEGFSSFTRVRGGKNYTMYCCADCISKRDQARTLNERNRFGKETKERNKLKQAAINRSLRDLNKRLKNGETES